MPAKEEMTFSTYSSMSEGEFFEWLKSKGVNERDRKKLFGKILDTIIMVDHNLYRYIPLHSFNSK